MSVPVTIHAVFQNIGRQHLHHADFASPCAGGFGRGKIALFIQRERRENLWAEQLWAATVMCQRDQ